MKRLKHMTWNMDGKSLDLELEDGTFITNATVRPNGIDEDPHYTILAKTPEYTIELLAPYLDFHKNLRDLVNDL